MQWGNLTWPDIGKAAENGCLVIQPLGSTEQHGHHLPVDTDAGIVGEVARRAAQKVNRTLVLPCLKYGISWHHIDFPGTISVSLETYIAVIKDIASCLARHGFKILILLNGHGGNAAALKAASSAFLDQIDLKIIALTYWEIIDSQKVATIRTSALGGMSHAGEFETSVQLALNAGRVYPDRYVANPRKAKLPYTKEDMFADGPVLVSARLRQANKIGVVGDPTSASAQKGQAFLDLAVDALAALLEALQTETVNSS